MHELCITEKMPIGGTRKGGIYKPGIDIIAHPVIIEHFPKIEIIIGHGGLHLSARHSGKPK